MSDLVSRLRRAERDTKAGIFREAADEIERLTQELEQYHATIDILQQTRAERDRLANASIFWEQEAGRHVSEKLALRAALIEARAELVFIDSDSDGSLCMKRETLPMIDAALAGSPGDWQQ